MGERTVGGQRVGGEGLGDVMGKGRGKGRTPNYIAPEILRDEEYSFR